MPSQHGVHTWIDDDCASDWPETWNAIAEFDTLPEQLSRQEVYVRYWKMRRLTGMMFALWRTMEAGRL